MTRWLDQVLPADLYIRTTSGGASTATGDTAYFTPDFVQAVARLPGVGSMWPTVRAGTRLRWPNWRLGT